MNPFALSGLLIGLSSTTMAVWVFFQNRANHINRLWSIFCIFVAIWGFGCLAIGLTKNQSLALIFWRTTYISVIFIPSLFYHFVTIFLGLHRRKSLVVAYAISIGFLIANTTPLMIPKTTWMFEQLNFLSPPGKIYPYFVLFFFLTVIVSHIDLWRFMKKTQDDLMLIQVKWFFMATAIGFSGAAICFLPVFGIKIYPYGNFTVSLYPIIMSYAIVKHQLMDIKVVIKRTLFYSLLAFSVSIFYFAMIFITHKMVVSEWDLRIYLINILNGLHFSFLNITKNLFSFTSFLCGLTSFGLAIFGLIVGKTKAQKLFIVFNLSVGLWGLGNFLAGISTTPEKALMAWRLAYFGGFFISTLFCHMVYVFFEIKNQKILSLSYLQSFLFSAIMITHPEALINHTRTAFGVYYNAITAPMAIAILLFILIVVATYGELLNYLKSSEVQNKMQAKYFIFGFAFGFIGGITTLIPPFGLDLIYPIGNLGVAIYVFILVYAMFRHQVLDVHIVIKRTIFYSILVFFISALYVLIIFLIHRLFLLENLIRPTLPNSIILVILIMLFLKPIEIFLHRFLDKKFFKGTITEIAEQKTLLQTELERQERLKSVGILAAGMAHEIKNPLTTIKTFAEYLPQKYDDPEFRENFKRIVVDEVDRVNNIVKQLLDFSRPRELSLKNESIISILEETLALLNSNLLKSKILVVKNYQADPYLRADRNQLKQVFLNIFLNSIQAMPGGGKLYVSTSDKNSSLLVEIKDTGIGITKDHLLRIFDPFFTTKEDGTGLGLSIVHGIITKHGGKINIQSAPGEGATISVALKNPG